MEARMVAGFAYDASRRTLVLAGGSRIGDLGISDTWELPETECVPTVSVWGLGVLTIVGLIAGTVLFNQRRTTNA
jgi:hypothetical protein